MKRIQGAIRRVLRRTPIVKPSPLVKPSLAPIERHSEGIAGDPFLPPELERAIFELAAETAMTFDWRQSVGSAVLALSLVCRRAKIWIDPIIYRTVPLLRSFVGQDPVSRFLVVVDSHPPSFFAMHVKSIYFDSSMPLSFVQRVLGVCTGATVVGCHHPYSSLAPLLAVLPLQRLLVSELTLPTAPEALPPWAASLTHLGISQTLPPDARAAFGAALPALTHLAVDYAALANPGMGAALAALFHACPRVHCLVLVTESKTDYKWAHQRLREDGFADARFYVHLRPVMDGTWDAWWQAHDLFREAEYRMKMRRGI